MPPKRQSPNSQQSGNAPKKSKTDANGTPALPEIPRSKRWSKVSATANADMEFKMMTRDPAMAYSWVCLCKKRFQRFEEDADDEDEEGGEAEKGDDGENPPCDGGETCPCMKPATEHPDHSWVIVAGIQKFITLSIQSQVRDPDAMDMYTYNDHFGYGVLELAQNLLLDFDEAKGDWKQQWSICESVIMFFARDVAEPLFGVDDGEGVQVFIEVIKTLFLSMLATLERNNILEPDSKIKNLGHIMALYIRYVVDALPDYSIESNDLEAHIFAYAAKHKIELPGLEGSNVDREELQENAQKIKLPEPTAKKNDPWDWAKCLREYKKNYGPIGGDKLDITTWTSVERKKHSFYNRDPLDKKMIDDLKEGLVMHLA